MGKHIIFLTICSNPRNEKPRIRLNGSNIKAFIIGGLLTFLAIACCTYGAVRSIIHDCSRISFVDVDDEREEGSGYIANFIKDYLDKKMSTIF